MHRPICRSRLRTIASALVAATAVTLLAACSSPRSAAPRSSPSPSERPLSKEEYVNQAAVLCSASQGSAGPEPTTAADFVSVLQSKIADLKALQAKLESLVPPAADEAKLREQFLAPKARTVKVFEDALPDIQKVAATGDLTATRLAFQPAAQQSVDLAARAQPFLTSYGLEACA